MQKSTDKLIVDSTAVELADTHACAIDMYLSHAELLNAEDSLSVNVCTFHLLA